MSENVGTGLHDVFPREFLEKKHKEEERKKARRLRAKDADNEIKRIGRWYETELTKQRELQAEKDRANHTASVQAEEKAGELFDELIPDYLVWNRDGLSATEAGYYTWIHPKTIGTLQVYMPFDAVTASHPWVEWSYWNGSKFASADSVEIAIGELVVNKHPGITELQAKLLINGPF